MSHSYSQTIIHLVFSTKDRRKSIPKELQARLWAYIAAICQKNKMFVHAIGGMEDHVHGLIQLPPTLAQAQAVLLIKAYSSKWMGKGFAWQKGYGVFSVSASNVPAVVRYIENQERHHRKRSFEQEFITLLKKHGVKFDPKYVFG
ncbi:MAG: IS200/IS605 family transposase [Acidobacteriia bacterium]|nr:IS200/IS605 family transposase [Terriglobia bacterium]